MWCTCSEGRDGIGILGIRGTQFDLGISERRIVLRRNAARRVGGLVATDIREWRRRTGMRRETMTRRRGKSHVRMAGFVVPDSGGGRYLEQRRRFPRPYDSRSEEADVGRWGLVTASASIEILHVTRFLGFAVLGQAVLRRINKRKGGL